MASDLGVIVKLRADASQYTAEFGQAKQLAQSLASTLQASGSQAAAGLATATTAAQGLGTATAASAQQASSSLAQAGAVAQAAGATLKATGVQADDAAAGLEGLAKASRETSQSQQQSRTAGESLIAMLRDQIATSGKSAEELLRYRAAQAGVAAEAAPLILQLQNQRAAQLAAAEAAQQEAAALRDAATSKRNAQAAADNFIQGLRDQAATQGLSATELLRYRAAQLGVSDAAAPYLRALDDAAQANGRGAISAGQHAAAMRMLPAQMTDVVTSIASGMPVWMVAIQQGGQIKDSFGGAGNAIRAMASAVTPTVAVFGTLAVAGGAVAAAYYQGSSEASAFRRELLMTGNAAGTSVSQLTDMARAVGDLTTTQSTAAQTLAQLAGTGAVAAENLQDFAETAINLERYVGEPVKTTVGHLEQLGKKPLEASVKLNEQYRYLTDSVYQQIKALQDQGKTDEAASLAQRTYSQAMGERAAEMRSHMGSLERGWDSLGKMAARAWDAMLNVGRAASLSDIRTKIDTTNAELNKLLAGDGFGETGGGAATGSGARGRAAAIARLRKELGDLEAQAAPLEAQEFESRTKADKQAADQAAVEARTRIEAQRKAMRTRAEIRQDEIKQLDRDRETLKLSSDEYNKLLANIEQKYKDPKGSTAGQVSITDTQIAGLKSQLQAAQQYHQQLLTLGASASELNAGERESLKLAEQIKLATNAKTKAKLEQAKAEADALGVQLRTNDGLDKSLKSHQALIDATNKDATSIEARAREQEAANTVFGKGRTAIEQMTLATLEHQIAEAQGSDSFDPAYIAALERKIEAQKRYVDALGQADYKAVIAHADELLRNAKELSKAYDDELALSGLTGLEREKIVAQRQVELKYAKEIAAIDKSSLTDSEKQQAKEKVYAAQRIESAAAGAKAQQTYMGKASEEINRNLTDALMRGFENGKGFAENLADTTENLFKSMVLRPVISAVMAPVSGVINGVVQSGLNAIGLGSGGNNLLGLASNASSLYSLTTGNSLIGQAANWLGIGSAAATAAGTATGIAATTGAGYTVAQGAIGLGLKGGIGATGSMIGGGGLGLVPGSAATTAIGGGVSTGVAGTTATGAAGGGLSGALAAVPGWGWALAGGALLLSQLDLGSRGANHVGAAYSTSGLGNAKSAEALFGRASGDWYDDLTQRHSADLEKQLGTSVEALSNVYKSLASYAGDSAKQIDIVAGFASNPAYGDEDSYGYFKLIDKLSGESIKEYTARDGVLGTDPKAAYTQFATELANGLIGQLRASGGLEKWVDAKLAKLGDAPSLEQLSQAVEEINAAQAALKQLGLAMPEFAAQSGAARAALMDQVGGSQALVERLGSFYSNYFSEAERTAVATQQVTEQLQALGYAMPTSRDEYRAWVTTAIEAGESGTMSAAGLLKLESAVAQLLPASKDAAAGVTAAAKALRSAADIASKEQDLQIQLLRAQGSELAAVALERKRELAALGEYGSKAQDLQQQIYAAQDAATAEKARQEAAAAAAAAAAEAAAAAAQIAQERLGLESQLLQLLGDTTALRQRELAALDASNRSLQERIWAVEDAQAAQEAARNLMQSAYSGVERAVAAERSTINARLQAQQAGNKAQIEAAQEASRAVQSIAAALSRAAKTVQVESAAQDWRRLQDARSLIEGAAQAPDISKVVGLEDALSVAGQDSRKYYATFADYAYDQAVTSSVIKSLDTRAQQQLSTAEAVVAALTAQDQAARAIADEQLLALDEQLNTAKLQLDAALGNVQETKTVAAAIADLANATRGYAAATAAAAVARASATSAVSAGAGAGSAAGGGGGGGTGQYYRDAGGNMVELQAGDSRAFWEAVAASGTSAVSSLPELRDRLTAAGKTDVWEQFAAGLKVSGSPSSWGVQHGTIVDSAGNIVVVGPYDASAVVGWAGQQGILDATAQGSGGALAGGREWSYADIAREVQTALTLGSSVDQVLAAGKSNYGVSEADIRAAAEKAGIPGFDVGTNYLPQDMLAIVHAGERIVPAADNRRLFEALEGGSDASQASAMLRVLDVLLRMEPALRSIASSTLDASKALAKQLDRAELQSAQERRAAAQGATA